MNIESEVTGTLRDFKLEILNGLEIKIDQEYFKRFTSSAGFNLFLKNSPNDIITGSTTLKLFGLLQREPNDIDIIVLNNREIKNINRWYGYEEKPLDFMGTKKITYRKYFWSRQVFVRFDYFKFSNQEYSEITYKDITFKLHNPIQLIQKKLEMCNNNHKHSQDIINLKYGMVRGV